MNRLVELWYAIPREKEWWIDKIAALLTGCSTGCFVLSMMYVITVAIAIGVCFTIAKDAGEALVMGMAWGSSLWIVTGTVGGSVLLAVIARLRGH